VCDLSLFGLLMFQCILTSQSNAYTEGFFQKSSHRSAVPHKTTVKTVFMLLDYCYHLECEVEVNLQLTVSRPVCLGVRIPSGAHDQISFILTIAGFLIMGAPSLTRGWVCNLLIQLLLGLARALTLGSKSRRTQAKFYCLI
jgi:hypothetical protein